MQISDNLDQDLAKKRAAQEVSRYAVAALVALLISAALGAFNLALFLSGLLTKEYYRGIFAVTSSVQIAVAVIAIVCGGKGKRNLITLLSALIAAGATMLGLFMAYAIGLGAGGGAWGRPLRIRGRQLHPELRLGSDWTQGDRPDPRGLDEPTRAALEALWLHDAQKEHASVPAFARLSWLLAAVGAPAELLEWSHRAALEEIAHTRLCFALAAGYGRRSFTVEPMPELLLVGLDLKGRPLEVMAIESVTDGCQLEDFNADVAAACAAACQEPVTRQVLEQIAREERSHAEFSWAMLEWLLSRDPQGVRAAIATALEKLKDYPRPTAVADDKKALFDRADVAALRRHGRLPDAEWAAAWDARLVKTRARIAELLTEPLRAAA